MLRDLLAYLKNPEGDKHPTRKRKKRTLFTVTNYSDIKNDTSDTDDTTTTSEFGCIMLLSRRWPRRLFKWNALLLVLLFLGIILTYINMNKLASNLDKVSCKNEANATVNYRLQSNNKTFAVLKKTGDSGYLLEVFDAFDSLGYVRGDVSKDWDVLWAHEYPFVRLSDTIKNLKPGQKVNHFPGTEFVTNKMYVATSGYEFAPRAFQIPQRKKELTEYAANSTRMFVQKSKEHRGIKIVKIDQLDFRKFNSFVQEYISNPLLIDGHKFDFGVFVVLTSLEPLRAYIYDGDVIFRFCPTPYDPFDPEILDKYVVGDAYKPIWEMESLRNAYEQGFSMKEAFDSYGKLQGKIPDPSKIWSQVDTAIRTVYLSKESFMIESWKKFGKKRNFFELVRFDFIIDANMKVFLMEVNMSPNLSSGRFAQLRMLFNQVLFSTLSLAGVANPLRSGTRRQDPRIVTTKQVALSYTVCSTCINCKSVDYCELCPACNNNEEDWSILKEAYLEHVNRMDFRRVIPEVNQQDKSKLTPKNRLMSLWYDAKCEEDKSWCA